MIANLKSPFNVVIQTGNMYAGSKKILAPPTREGYVHCTIANAHMIAQKQQRNREEIADAGLKGTPCSS